jgi:SsrA-binding protein
MHKREIMALKGRSEAKNIGIVPISLYTTKEGLIKLEVALGKGKKQYEKREKIKKMTIQREAEEDLANRF